MNKSIQQGRIFFAAAIAALAACGGGISVELPKNPCDTLRIAADEFRKYHQLVTGTEAKGDRRIRLKVDPKLSPDGNDTYTIMSDAQGATLAGDKPRCVLYAVYDLLERRAGCRWFWDGDVVPKRDAIDLSGLDVREHSRFEFRATRFFSHRGLTRFRAQQWGPEDWIREIDYLAKIRINCVMLRIGWDDIFQKAFPDVCEYPDPSKPLPGTGEGYDNHSLFWSLQFRGLLRSMIHERAFKRGMSIPEDFGTMTHWYSRTPKDFLDKMKPDFLPQATEWYQEPSGLVWDIRQKKWMEAYWKLTDASIRAYGKPDVLHTMGLSERTCCTNAEENLQMKIDVMRRLCVDARTRYPNSRIILGGWDFHFTWEPEECRRLWPALADLGGLLLWDYESDEVRNKGPATKCLRTNILSNWDVIGKFPYTFGIFAYAASSADIRANYPAIEREWAKSADDPFCKGYIWWPEVEHNDILFYRYFAVNSWRGGHKVQTLLPDFCIDRYGAQAKAMEGIWRKTLPIVTGLDYSRLFAKPVTHLPTIFDRTDSWRKIPWRAALNEAPKVYRALAALDWQDDFTRRDTIDIARTVADRLILASLSKMYYAYQRWNGGKGEADELLRWTETSRALVEAIAATLALHTDYSLWESYLRLDKVEKVRNPNFPQVLLENASCGYCKGYQYECAAHWYVPVMRDMEHAIKAKVASGKRGGTLAAPRTDYHGTLLATPLKKLAPASPRTPEAYRKTMLRFAETLEKMLPCPPERDDTAANATDEILM